MPSRPTPRQAIVEGVAAVAAAIQSLGLAISLAALVFTGALIDGLPRAIGSFVVGAAISAIVIGWKSALVPVASIVQDGPAVVAAVVAASLVATNEVATTDAFVLLLLITSATALAMGLIARFRLTHLVRYLPTTVVGSFVAGTGYLLIKGGLEIAIGQHIALSQLGALFEDGLPARWLPAVGVGLVVFWVQASRRLPPLATSVSIVGMLAAFFLCVAAFSSMATVEADGWLIGPFDSGTAPAVVTPSELTGANWAVIIDQLPGALTVVAVAVVAMLLNSSSLEFVADQRLDLDQEVGAAALGNALMAPFAVLPGFHALGDTVLMRRMGATSRTASVATGVLVAAFGLGAASLVGWAPRLVLGGLLITVGLALMVDWYGDLRREVNRLEQVMGVFILGVIAAVGVLEGIVVGIVAACAVFVIRYSRIDPIRRQLTAHQVSSRVSHSPSEQQVLSASADRLRVFELQGYLFFGSVTALDATIRRTLEPTLAARGAAPADTTVVDTAIDTVVLECSHVTGLDASSTVVFSRLIAAVEAAGATFLFVGAQEALASELRAAGGRFDDADIWLASLDLAVERFEKRQLAAIEPTGGADEVGMSPELAAYFTEHHFPAGTPLIRTGDTSDVMLVLVSGHLSAYRPHEVAEDGNSSDGCRMRLRRYRPGALLGEIGLITGGTRTADVDADTDVSVLMLRRDRFERLPEEAPELAIELYELIVARQAERVIDLTNAVAEQSRA